MQIGTRLIAIVLIISVTACNTYNPGPNVEELSAEYCGAYCPPPEEVITHDGTHPDELVNEYFDTDAQMCVYATAEGEYTQPILCFPPIVDEESISAFLAAFECEDCGCAGGVCPVKIATTDADVIVPHNIIVDFAKLIGALTKVAGVAKLYCVIKAALKAAKTAATAISKARGHTTQLKALLMTYPVAAQRTPAIVAQIQGEAWRASANYARSLAAARLSLKKSAEAIGIMTAAWAGGNYLLGSKEADEKAKAEIEEGMKDAEATLAGAHNDVLGGDLPADVKATRRGRYNRAIEETQKAIDELKKKAMTPPGLCDDEKELLAVLEQQKATLVKERDALEAGK